MTTLATTHTHQSETGIGLLIRFAEQVAGSELLPDAYRGKPNNIVIAAMLGEGMGLSWAQALYRINVIKGKPTASAELIASNVRRSGHRLRIETTDGAARVTITRSDDPDFSFTSVWTVDKARRAGLLGKDNWAHYLEQMLVARAITECARRACPEALYGVAYDPSELDDRAAPFDAVRDDFAASPTTGNGVTETEGFGVGVTPHTPDSGLSRDSFRANAQTPRGSAETPMSGEGSDVSPSVADPTPELEPELPTMRAHVVEPGLPMPKPKPMTDGQRRLMFRLLNRLPEFDSHGNSAEGRAARISFVNGILGTAYTTTGDLSMDEAARVLDVLERKTSEPHEPEPKPEPKPEPEPWDEPTLWNTQE